ncbi:type IV toxin-antitoxin system AbiEi family antitoxin [Conexibacter sp. JD483]|uniref:type IV toxin-antitoxin system AbiEi family antitoxin n=1 Tax=unclassified Conexibacter TaxID=2627773 RepID=UPI002720EC84|nr:MULTISPECIES: type IV toxin-antitoxin system AbiEi family antitoxin [unclassified Conexibacter]MDO8186121.1 type IV toxin-antitoxin system AbiEi family antitoxin [Conexibacter sp. CPCC 205706]MDO8199611.1 type IV toxin-antitoxin system AbiEi family antitoxin [Conexibacter sp. CPCC 205762]MDR9369135.1 type IV toxin-antitoxin system AbiEi family antitoxin [Conexibacter sp. JD483]
MANAESEETLLLEAAVERLREMLPDSWRVAVEGSPVRSVVLTAPNGVFASFAIDVRAALAPRDVPLMLTTLGRSIRDFARHVPALVIAPWISPRTQQLLDVEQISYVDLTGNARVQLDSPPLFLSSVGAGRDPRPASRGSARVRGPKSGRLFRTLVEVPAPLGVRELAAHADLAPGYVSRMLDTLDREALVTRSPRGAVVAVDVPGLLRRWAENYDVLRANRAQRFVAPRGLAETQELLAERVGDEAAITGSFAAIRLVRVSAPALLLVYCDDGAEVAGRLDLLAVDEGADVALLTPFDDVVWRNTERRDGLRFVAPAQVAVDCLTGTGRMPSEGEAILSWIASGQAGDATT